MKKNNFVITGYGRSGTKFLSTVLNKSERWTVMHEPRGGKDEKAFRARAVTPQFANIRKEFKREYYGEVNSYLRFYLPLLKKEFEVGVILRQPKEIITSVMNRKHINNYQFFIDDLKYAYDTFKTHEADVKLIDFKKMVTDKDYIINISNYFSIFDIDKGNINLKEKNNRNKNIKYADFDDLPENVKTYFNKQFGHEYNIFNNFTFTDF